MACPSCAVPAQLVVVVVAILLAAPKLSHVQPLRHIDISFNMSGRTVVITGGNSGVGLEAARDFAGRGASVTLTSRSLERAAATAASLPNSVGMALDLTDPASVRAFATAFRAALGDMRLDVLILNAGMVYGPDFRGPYATAFPGGRVDTMIAANHLGHFLLLQELLGLVEASGTRVVFVSSISHHLATRLPRRARSLLHR